MTSPTRTRHSGEGRNPHHLSIQVINRYLTPATVVVLSTLLAIPAPAQSNAIPAPLTSIPGDPDRGRAIAADPDRGNCSICHLLPGADPRQHGDLAPPLAGAGSRNTAGALRQRIVDSSRINPATIMPPYHRVAGLARVAPAYARRPILSAQEVEDVVAWLLTLRE